jgi:hypothetical protein
MQALEYNVGGWWTEIVWDGGDDDDDDEEDEEVLTDELLLGFTDAAISVEACWLDRLRDYVLLDSNMAHLARNLLSCWYLSVYCHVGTCHCTVMLLSAAAIGVLRGSDV